MNQPDTTLIPDRTEVLIVGYGPVGAALACLLGRYGVRTLVVDKAQDILQMPRAIALDNEALRILQAAGLPEEAFEKVAIPYVRMHSPVAGQFACINTGGSIDGHPKLVTFYQPELERALRDRVASLESVDVATGVQFMGFTDRVDGVSVELQETDGDPVTVQARYLVGADGASSRIRGLIGQAFDGSSYKEDWLIVDAKNVAKPIDHVEFLCDPARPTPHMVAPGGRQRWEFMLHPGESREDMETDDKIAELLAPWQQDGKPMTIERKAVYRFHARCCKNFQQGRVFLAGDAAHVTPPFVGQGLVAGLRDAINLGWKLAWVCQGRAGPQILDSYDMERRPHARAMINLARYMGRLIMPRSRPAAYLTHGLAAMLRLIPALRSYFEDLKMKPQNAYKRGLFRAGKSGSALQRGAWLPQCLVRDRDGRIGLSDDAIGPTLTLAGFGVDPRSCLSDQSIARWQAAGGHCLQFSQRGQRLPCSPDAVEVLDNSLMPDPAPNGWLAVIRPDRTILHDGPVADADRLVLESLELLLTPAAPETSHSPVAPTP